MKTLLTAIVLTVVPTFALAMGCSNGHTTASISCADGTTFDAETNSCVPTTS